MHSVVKRWQDTHRSFLWCNLDIIDSRCRTRTCSGLRSCPAFCLEFKVHTGAVRFETAFFPRTKFSRLNIIFVGALVRWVPCKACTVLQRLMIPVPSNIKGCHLYLPDLKEPHVATTHSNTQLSKFLTSFMRGWCRIRTDDTHDPCKELFIFRGVNIWMKGFGESLAIYAYISHVLVDRLQQNMFSSASLF